MWLLFALWWLPPLPVDPGLTHPGPPEFRQSDEEFDFRYEKVPLETGPPPSLMSEGPRFTMRPEDEGSPVPELGESPQPPPGGPTEEVR